MLGFLTRLISSIISRKEKEQIVVQLGKYTTDIDFAKNGKLSEALTFYRQERYGLAYKSVLEYLMTVSFNGVVLTEKEDGKIGFIIYQGSKQVEGEVSDDMVIAHADVVRYSGELKLELMEMLLKENYFLRYGRFVLLPDRISLKFDSKSKCLTPYDFYNALREIALTADRYDDILIESYNGLEPINIQHIIELSPEQKKAKVDFFKLWIRQYLTVVDRLTKDKFGKEHNKGLVSYILLSLIYKLYYLIAPEGVLLDELKQMDSLFWEGHEDVIIKNEILYNRLMVLYKMNNEQLSKWFYNVRSTFSMVKAVEPEKIKSFIEAELESLKWMRLDKYYSQYYIYGLEYILGYLCFHIAMKPVYIELVNIVWRAMNDKFFLALGYHVSYRTLKDKLNSFTIENAINQVLGKYNIKTFRSSKIDYTSDANFMRSFLVELVNMLEYEK